MKKRKEYPQDFIEICEVVDEKVAKKRAILELILPDTIFEPLLISFDYIYIYREEIICLICTI